MMNNLLNTASKSTLPSRQAAVIMATSLSLSRNVAGYKFVTRASDNELQDILDIITDSVYERFGRDYDYYEPDFQDPFLGDIWAEDQLTSIEFDTKTSPRGVLVNSSNKVSIVINDKNHLKLQANETGLKAHHCWKILNSIDDGIETSVQYSFSPQFGYLTTNLKDAGTGMKLSFDMHLPALAMNGSIEDLHQFADAKDIEISGCRGDCEPEGDLYKITNNITIGVSEEKIVEDMTKIALRIAQFETKTREMLAGERFNSLLDTSQRALGLLRYARMIDYTEAASLLSELRLGILTGIIKEIPLSAVDRLLEKIKPARLDYDNCEVLGRVKSEILRADIIRQAFATK